jgi:hypothetical protein
MKVFRVSLDSNKFQSLLPCDQAIWRTEALEMNCSPKMSAWCPPAVYVSNPRLRLGNFLHLCSGGFVTDPKGLESLRDLLEMAGELLPLPHDGFTFWLTNVLECFNCLDAEASQWVLGKTTGARVAIRRYEFFRDRFGESTLFKIPETAAGEVLTVSGMKDPEDEFKSRVEQAGLQGILFEELWSDQVTDP